MKYIANLSGGKDSLAMVLKLIEEHRPLDYVLFYDAGMEFQSIYNNINKIKPILKSHNIEFIQLKPDNDFLFDMLVRPVNKRDGSKSYGYDWCGRNCRWQTSMKVSKLNKFLSQFEEYIQYIGIAYDEPDRIKHENNKQYPLYEWEMTESDCLEYCYSHGWNWLEKEGNNYVELYSILDRVSCWCCWNKNLKELQGIYEYLPSYWNKLLGLQSRIERPFKDKYDLFELDRKFKQKQISLFDKN